MVRSFCGCLRGERRKSTPTKKSLSGKHMKSRLVISGENGDEIQVVTVDAIVISLNAAAVETEAMTPSGQPTSCHRREDSTPSVDGLTIPISEDANSKTDSKFDRSTTPSTKPITPNDGTGIADFMLPSQSVAPGSQLLVPGSDDEAEAKLRESSMMARCLGEEASLSAVPCTMVRSPTKNQGNHEEVAPQNEIVPLHREPSISVIHRGPPISANDVLEVISKSWESNIFQTQEYLYDMLYNHVDADFVSIIRKSDVYDNIMRTLRAYDKAPGIFEVMTDYLPAGNVEIDYLSLGIGGLRPVPATFLRIPHETCFGHAFFRWLRLDVG
eukprot:GEMP01005039.1.p1 GENE.GEMP01005039.1~~GEMP01005039.1.p1  ORF type:complete len:328 (+),score=48.15 GEMP01005039.1:309-1292(+)